MRVVRLLVVVPLFVAMAGCAGVAQRPPPLTPSDATMQREILLTIKQETGATFLTGAPDTRYLRRRGYGAVPREIDQMLDRLAEAHGLERKKGWPIRSLGVYCEVFAVPEDIDLATLIERLRSDPRVDLAQPMNLFETLGGYDDPYLDLQPAVVELGIERAHRLATGKGVRIAVIDSAVDAEHPELRGQVRIQRDLVTARRRPARAEVHGTAVAGIIASAANNREGIVGIAPDVELASLRACWSHPDLADGGARCSSFTLAQALDVAIEIDAALINLSLSGPDDPLLDQLLDEAIGRGIVVVAADPGIGASNARFPSSHPQVILARSSSRWHDVGFEPADGADSTDVGAVEEGRLQRYRLPAPAEEIFTTAPAASYGFFSGASLAAAHLSGVIALLLERAPSLGVHQIVDVLRTTVRTGSRASVDACHAVEAVTGGRTCETSIRTARASGG